MPSVTVTPLNVMAESRWDFGAPGPTWQHPVTGYGSRAVWDPFPCYPHDQATALAAVRTVTAACPPLWDVYVMLADREDTGRCNAWSHTATSGHYEGDDWVPDPPAGLIMLNGKRIPPHPAVTAHLIGHEYGHQAEWMINQAAGRGIHDGAVSAGYTDVRMLQPAADRHAAGGDWHSSVHEIMACDFRILVCGLETGYWPHPGIPRPEDVPGLDMWWAAQMVAIASWHPATIPAV